MLHPPEVEAGELSAAAAAAAAIGAVMYPGRQEPGRRRRRRSLVHPRGGHRVQLVKPRLGVETGEDMVRARPKAYNSW